MMLITYHTQETAVHFGPNFDKITSNFIILRRVVYSSQVEPELAKLESQLVSFLFELGEIKLELDLCKADEAKPKGVDT